MHVSNFSGKYVTFEIQETQIHIAEITSHPYPTCLCIYCRVASGAAMSEVLAMIHREIRFFDT
jgi:hypothetical protein